ncbi:hypothetical protein TRM7615_05004 [Falsiruegeria mediterranea M17]|uniref:Uncharacterized protein n=1 Tax=Falsiruegeria mediterranea M17 TaxID=1200281 RepID=A0A2R8CGA8_9RHOB|nr:hypothetical protein TRM7615_05004 [Falsiruegeria mediterranea M17]
MALLSGPAPVPSHVRSDKAAVLYPYDQDALDLKYPGTACVIAPVSAVPPRSGGNTPAFRTLSTAPTMARAAGAHPKPYSNIMATDKIAPIGLAMPRPEMSGALPWVGSYRPPFTGLASRAAAGSVAEGNIPNDPEITAIRSEMR